MTNLLDWNADSTARQIEQKASTVRDVAKELPAGTPAAKRRKNTLFAEADALTRLAVVMNEAKIEQHRLGVIKTLGEHVKTEVAYELNSLLESEREILVELASNNLASVLKWDAQRGMEISLKRTILRDFVAAIENPDLPDYGLAEAIEQIDQRFDYFDPSNHSTSTLSNLYDQVEFKVYRDLRKRFVRWLDRIQAAKEGGALAGALSA